MLSGLDCWKLPTLFMLGLLMLQGEPRDGVRGEVMLDWVYEYGLPSGLVDGETLPAKL